MEMRTTVVGLAEEAEQQIREGVWERTSDSLAGAARAAAGLGEAVGPRDTQEVLPAVERLAHLREALAVLAIELARTHGSLAWFLAGASTALSPVLHWRALPADRGRAFGTVVPTSGQFTEAEDAVRHLQDTLTRIAAPIT
ncbi:hypothetical protein [Kitasatospora sp. NBC_01539]|uniref:hypothetical protein n=1 Tax=Kitasatospora sp. NBC_01539 TaxID=2903577 RepID=UPI0038602A78